MKASLFLIFYLTGAFLFAQNTKPMLNGCIYEDVNHNGLKDPSEKGISNVRVSNGIDVHVSDQTGNYELELLEGQTFFVIKPTGYQLPTDEFNISEAYFHYYPKKSESLYAETIPQQEEAPQSFDIPLYKHEENKEFSMAMIGDTQARFQRQVNYAHQIAEELLYEELEGAAILGDIGDDNAMIFPAFQQLFKQFGTQIYPVAGNHDRNYDSQIKGNEFNSFKKAFGPDHYSFDIGNVHFIVMNDVTTIKGIQYTDIIPEDNLLFIENDLKYVSKDQLVVFLQHIPINHLKVESKQRLLDLIADYSNVMAFSGHMHKMTHNFIPYGKENTLHEIVVGAACGLWWGGEFDEKGIPNALMGDGAPKGYYVANFKNNEVQLEFRATGKPKREQMHIWVYQEENTISDPTMELPKGMNENQFLVNVWAGSEKTEVTARIDKGEWFPLLRTDEILDPYVRRAFLLDSLKLSNHKSHLGNSIPKNMASHIWIGDFPTDLKKGSHLIEIKATDELGIDVEGIRVFTKGNFDGEYKDIDWYNMN
ncbi:calcineurin-like phosphoesterase C-terminal domain-containing protein [Sediminitomix flava]|uniref:3',5'-cyclic AMP phosphodiesterase CpdA n=1 Tax=Sediminitomix flava TaxID=379075 RepID=A0A315Z5M0_SEDFL|nr:calcineurin-like phosphoesterase family protein [Sediminitomix flava]PWJ38499.1 3',5'-cyclic AMP phosphodiesterase CpdA [Sediminitomix flava]